MKAKSLITFFALFLFSINFIYSEEMLSIDKSDDRVIINKDTKEVKLNEELAVKLALTNNLDIKVDKLKFDNSVWKMVTSWNIFVPTISMSATLSKSNLDHDERTTKISGLIPAYDPTDVASTARAANGIYDFVVPYSADATRLQWSLVANFNLSLNINAAMGFQVYQTILDYQSGALTLENTKKKISRDVKKNFYNLILLEKNIEITQDSLKTAENRFNQATINYKNGLISDYDRLSAEVAFINIKPQLVEMQNNYNNAMLAFKQLIGIKKDVNIIFDAVIETNNKKSFNADELIQKYASNNLDLKILKNSVNSLINLRNINIGLLTPTFTLMYTMDPTYNRGVLTHDWFGDADYMEDHWKQRSGMFAFTVSLPVSSWTPFSKEQMNVVNAQYNASETQIGYEKLMQATELQIESAVLKLGKSMDSIDSLKLSLDLANKAYTKAEEAYRMGQKELLDVQNSEIELKKAKLYLLNEEYNYTTGLLDLEYLINSKLDK